jgi:hypothetical protein
MPFLIQQARIIVAIRVGTSSTHDALAGEGED